MSLGDSECQLSTICWLCFPDFSFNTPPYRPAFMHSQAKEERIWIAEHWQLNILFQKVTNITSHISLLELIIWSLLISLGWEEESQILNNIGDIDHIQY